jgi:hypothetical protein
MPARPAKVLSLTITDHGGGCCGITHLSGFGSYTDKYLKDQKLNRRNMIAEAVMEICAKEYGTDDDVSSSTFMKHRHCVEVVLSERQVEEWDKPLRLEGFAPVFSFENANSGNVCFVYMYETGVQ